MRPHCGSSTAVRPITSTVPSIPSSPTWSGSWPYARMRPRKRSCANWRERYSRIRPSSRKHWKIYGKPLACARVGVIGVPVVLEQKTTIRCKSLHIWGTTSSLVSDHRSTKGRKPYARKGESRPCPHRGGASVLTDHVVCLKQECRRDRDPECLGGL